MTPGARIRDPDGGERRTAVRCEGEELEQQMASDAARRSSSAPVYIEEPAVSKWLFGSSKAAWIWLVVRLWLGYEWLHAGWEKVTSPAWMDGGKALKGFAAGAIASSKDPDHPQVAYGWWVSFLHWVSDNAAWMGKMVAVGEVIIGIALILGLFTGIFAFLGVVLNFSFVFSGSAGVNPLFIILGLLLVLAWRNAGWIGLDRFVLPKLGTPWQRGELFDRSARGREPTTT
jgi:thiosulfate dehydrogenase (quinone) large subunit